MKFYNSEKWELSLFLSWTYSSIFITENNINQIIFSTVIVDWQTPCLVEHVILSLIITNRVADCTSLSIVQWT